MSARADLVMDITQLSPRTRLERYACSGSPDASDSGLRWEVWSLKIERIETLDVYSPDMLGPFFRIGVSKTDRSHYLPAPSGPDVVDAAIHAAHEQALSLLCAVDFRGRTLGRGLRLQAVGCRIRDLRLPYQDPGLWGIWLEARVTFLKMKSHVLFAWKDLSCENWSCNLELAKWAPALRLRAL